MSNSDVLLDVFIANDSTEVMVIDSDFRLLARGIGSVQLHVPPGIYQAKTRFGNQQNETLFAVDSKEPGNHKVVELSPVKFRSPIPLKDTLTSREFHVSAISGIASSPPAVHLGDGAELLIFIRDTSGIYFDLDEAANKADGEAANAEAMRAWEAYAKNFDGFALTNLEGSFTHSLECIGVCSLKQGYIIASVAVSPGTYVLTRISSDKDRLCLTLVVPPDWSLQVFVSMEPSKDSRIGRQADFDSAAMVFQHPGSGFLAERPDLRALEVMRNALVAGHNILNAKDVAFLESETIINPMMGLFAAHLILLKNTPNIQWLQDIITNTSHVIGADYPDVLILSWKLKQMQGIASLADAEELVRSLKNPPILQLSWHYLMEASRSGSNANFICTDIYNLASQLVSSSVWLTWLQNSDDIEVMGIADGIDNVQTGPEVEPYSVQEAILFSKSVLPTNITEIFRLGISVLQKSFSKKPESTNDIPSSESPPEGHSQEQQGYPSPNLSANATNTLEALLHKAGIIAQDSLNVIGIDAVMRLFVVLAKQVDWGSIVAYLKGAALLEEEHYSLTSLQRQLLLNLKAASEYLEDEGDLPLDVFIRSLNFPDVPPQTILNNLKRLFLFAVSLTKRL